MAAIQAYVGWLDVARDARLMSQEARLSVSQVTLKTSISVTQPSPGTIYKFEYSSICLLPLKPLAPPSTFFYHLEKTGLDFVFASLPTESCLHRAVG